MPVNKRHRSSASIQLLEKGESETGDHQTSDIRGDELNIAILLFLYTLQGIPLGLSGAIPMLLQNRGITYTQQAEFSFVSWPFSSKLIWAPIVDALYFPKFGRRKTWLVPIQYLIGIMMLLLSINMTDWLGSDKKAPAMTILTMSFFTLNLLAATQDIAVDGWALTMLKRCNVGHASTCNTIGQTAGYFLGYVLFMALESPSFCNTYLRTEPSDVGLVTLASFLYFWGWIFIILTTLVALFKHEVDVIPTEQKNEKGFKVVVTAYRHLYEITKLPSVRSLALILFTAKIGFCASDAVSGLKLVEAGVPREDLALLAIPLVPVQILLPLILSKHTTGQEPLGLWLKAYPLRLIVGPVVALVVYFTPYMLADSKPSFLYLSLLLLLYIFHQGCLYSMFVAVMGFFAKVSDPAVGGTYMTLLNTVTNLGTNWPNTVALWAIDHLTFSYCSSESENDNKCSSALEKEACKVVGGKCIVTLDGFYIEIVVCLVVGFLWLAWAKPRIQRLQRRPLGAWHLSEAALSGR